MGLDAVSEGTLQRGLLDASLATDGENIVLRRVKGANLAAQVNVDVTCRAFVRGYQADELVGDITQQDRRVILSGTEITAADWPADEPDSTSAVDHRVPSKNRKDRCQVQGNWCSVEAAEPMYIDSILVRIDMRVRGLA